MKSKDKIRFKINIKINLEQILSFINIPLFGRVHEYSRCIHKWNEMHYIEEQERPPNLSYMGSLILKNNIWTLKGQKQIKREKETPKLPLKLHYGSKLPSKSLQKWLKNQCWSRVAAKPPRSTRTNPYKKKKKHTTQGVGYPTIWLKHALWTQMTISCTMEEKKLHNSMMKKWERHIQQIEKYGGMWSCEDKVCNASDHECRELWL